MRPHIEAADADARAGKLARPVLEIVEGVDVDPEAAQPAGRFRPDGEQFSPVCRSIGNRDVLVDDVAFQMGQDSLGGSGVGIEPQARVQRHRSKRARSLFL